MPKASIASETFVVACLVIAYFDQEDAKAGKKWTRMSRWNPGPQVMEKMKDQGRTYVA
jgi:hypothetical protein